jgi:orotate phosphoribosyltransferase-like protein
MTLLTRVAELHMAGCDRDEIAKQLMLTREMVDWLMDSDSFAVVIDNGWGAQ